MYVKHAKESILNGSNDEKLSQQEMRIKRISSVYTDNAGMIETLPYYNAQFN